MRTEYLPGDQKRKQILSARLKAIRESLSLRQGDLERIAPELSEPRIRQWENTSQLRARPRATSFVVLSQVFGYPYEYFWPPVPEDGALGVDVDDLARELYTLGQKLREGKATQEDTERYQRLLLLEAKLASRKSLHEFARPPLHLVCVLVEFPSEPEGLPKPVDPWEGAWVMAVPGAERWDQVYAYTLPVDSGLPAGTTVLFRPLFDRKPSRERWTIGNRRGTPVAFRDKAPEDTTVIGEVLLAMYEPRR